MVNKWPKGGHKSLSTKRLVVKSLSDIETSNFKALLTYHFLISLSSAINLLWFSCSSFVQSGAIKTVLYTVHYEAINTIEKLQKP